VEPVTGDNQQGERERMATVDLDYPASHIALITLDNPPVNTLSWESRAALIDALGELDANLDVRCVVVTGAGRVFTPGADLREDQVMEVNELPAFLADFERICNGFEHLRAPVIAAINGPAVGGGLEVALSCDIRIAASTATFVAAGVNVGLMANFWRLARVVGLGPAKEILLTGEHYSAAQALGWGLVTEVCAPDDLMTRAMAKAERIASRAPLSVEATKRAVHDALTLDAAQAQERQVTNITELFMKDDHREALRSFFSGTAGDYHRK
jgi:enoyl-CoA hydratase